MRRTTRTSIFNDLLLYGIMITFLMPLNAQRDQAYTRPDIRTYASQDYRYIGTGSGSSMPTPRELTMIIQSKEAEIEKHETNTRIQPVTIPIVFHLLHTDDATKAKSIVSAQIAALNRDFSNGSWTRTHPNDPEGKYLKRAASAQITFVPAAVEGRADSPGISTTRRSSRSYDKWDDMKDQTKEGSRAYKPGEVINIWVCDLPKGTDSYASSIYHDIGSERDGIVLDADYFESLGSSSSAYNQGKTLTHLMGNFLGLHDLWSEERHCQDDYVDDTPVHNAYNYGKPRHHHFTTCPGENRATEMIMNFMDNSDDELQTMFTAGQVKRMHTVLTLYRKDLITSPVSN